MKAKNNIGGALLVAGLLLIMTGHLGLAVLGIAAATAGAYLMGGFNEDNSTTKTHNAL